MSQEHVAPVVTTFDDLSRIVQAADPADKADMHAKLKLTLTSTKGETWRETCGRDH